MNAASGVSPKTRVLEVQRDLSYAQSRYLATRAETWTSIRTVADFQRQLEREKETHRAALLTEAQDTEVALAKVDTQIKASAEKFAVVGGARSALYLRPDEEANVSIFRKVDGHTERLPATSDSDVLAGDVVEIDLKPGRLLGMAGSSTAPGNP